MPPSPVLPGRVLAQWYVASTVALAALGVFLLRQPFWALEARVGVPLGALLAAHASGGAWIAVQQRRRGSVTLGSALGATGFAFCATLAVFFVADISFSRKVLGAVIVGSFGFTAALFVLPRSLRAATILVTVLGAVTAAALGIRTARPADVPRLRQATLSTNLYNVAASFHMGVIAWDSIRGGAIVPWGDDYLLVSGGGRFFVATHAGGGTTVEPVALRVPLNTDEFRAAVATRSVDPVGFRTADLLAQELGPDSVRIFASHLFWHADSSCAVLRVSVVEGKTPALLQAADPGWRTLFETSPCLPLKPQWHPFQGQQSGGRMALMDHHTLLLTVGDFEWDGVNATQDLPQDMTASYGKTITVDLRSRAARIFTMGHRNPQGLAIKLDGSVWETEHAAKGGDELNRLIRATNYGWPLETYGTNYGSLFWPLNKAQGRHTRFAPPVYAWVPSIGVSNLVEVTSEQFALWKGDLLVASLVGHTLFRIRVDGDHARFAEPIRVDEGIRDLTFGRNGELALLLDGGGVAFLAPAVAAGASGEVLFATKCSGCHQVRNGLAHGIGPDLLGFAGRRVATAREYRYSAALTALAGRWTAERLDAWLRNTQQVAPGTAMPDAAVNDAAERAAIVTYLLTLR